MKINKKMIVDEFGSYILDRINNLEEIVEIVENYYFTEFALDYTKASNFIYNIVMNLQTIRKTEFKINGTGYIIEASTQEEANEIGFRDDIIYEYIKGNNRNLINLHKLDEETSKEAFDSFKNSLDKEIY